MRGALEFAIDSISDSCLFEDISMYYGSLEEMAQGVLEAYFHFAKDQEE